MLFRNQTQCLATAFVIAIALIPHSSSGQHHGHHPLRPLVKANRACPQRGNYTFQLLDVPEAQPSAINNRDYTIVNFSALLERNTTFLRHPNDTYVLIEYPGGNSTVGIGINNQLTIVGGTFLSDGYAGFIRTRNGEFTTFFYPGTGGIGTGTESTAINDHNVVVGTYYIGPEDSGAFVRQPDGTFESFQHGVASFTTPYGINNRGQISGQSSIGSFLRDPDGTFHSIEVPGATETQAFGINNAGQVVGLYVTEESAPGFVRDSDGTFHTVEYPGALSTLVFDINDSGRLAGYINLNEVQFGFIATPKHSFPDRKYW